LYTNVVTMPPVDHISYLTGKRECSVSCALCVLTLSSVTSKQIDPF